MRGRASRGRRTPCSSRSTGRTTRRRGDEKSWFSSTWRAVSKPSSTANSRALPFQPGLRKAMSSHSSRCCPTRSWFAVRAVRDLPALGHGSRRHEGSPTRRGKLLRAASWARATTRLPSLRPSPDRCDPATGNRTPPNPTPNPAGSTTTPQAVRPAGTDREAGQGTDHTARRDRSSWRRRASTSSTRRPRRRTRCPGRPTCPRPRGRRTCACSRSRRRRRAGDEHLHDPARRDSPSARHAKTPLTPPGPRRAISHSPFAAIADGVRPRGRRRECALRRSNLDGSDLQRVDFENDGRVPRPRARVADRWQRDPLLRRGEPDRAGIVRLRAATWSPDGTSSRSRMSRQDRGLERARQDRKPEIVPRRRRRVALLLSEHLAGAPPSALTRRGRVPATNRFGSRSSVE